MQGKPMDFNLVIGIDAIKAFSRVCITQYGSMKLEKKKKKKKKKKNSLFAQQFASVKPILVQNWTKRRDFRSQSGSGQQVTC